MVPIRDGWCRKARVSAQHVNWRTGRVVSIAHATHHAHTVNISISEIEGKRYIDCFSLEDDKHRQSYGAGMEA